MGDANVRRPVATRFEHGVDFGLLVHKSPFMADDRDPQVLSNYIFELLEVNPGVAGFLIQLHPDDVDAVVESVTAHAEKGAGTKTTLYVGQEEEEVEEVEEEEEDAGGVGAGGRKEKPHNPLMISVQKVRIRPGKGKGQSDGWFPQPLTHNTRRVCTDDPENKLPMHSLCPTREWEREWYGVTTPNIVSGQGVILFPFGATPPLIGEAEEVVAAEPLGAFNRDPNDLVLTVTVGGKLVVNHLLEHDFLSDVQLQSLLDDLDRVPLSGDGKGMQAMGGAGSKCWLCKDPNGIVEQRGVESTSRWGSFLRSVTPDRRPGDYQHAACRILNGIAKRIETTLQALPPSTPGKAQALAALQAFKQALKDETAGIPLRERLPSASRATEKDFDLTSTKVFLTSPPFQRQFVECLKEHVPTVRTPGGPMLWVVVHVMVKCIEGLYELWRVRELYTLTQVERHRALTTKFSKAWGDSGWSPTRWIHWCLAHSTFFAEKWRNIFQFSSIPTEYRHGPYNRRLKNCFKGWSLVRPSMSLRHMHHCMSMNALEQGLLGLEAAKASDIDDFV